MINRDAWMTAQLQFLWGYLQGEPKQNQFDLIANLLIRFLIDHVHPDDHRRALDQIHDSIPTAKAVNMPTIGGMQ